MFKDPRIQLSIAGFLLFFTAWCVLTYNGVPDSNSLMKFVQEGTITVGGVLLLFIKTDGVYQKPEIPTAKESLPVAEPEAPAP